jgi:uncharacterized cupin superfamily protein
VIAHWDDVEALRRAVGPMAATWQPLGDAAGARGIGVNLVRIDPGRLSTPPHSHARAEEISFVLSGSGLSWQDEVVCEVRAGDTIVHLADHEEHTLRAGPDGLDVLAFGSRHPVEYGWLPRSRAMRMGYAWTEGRVDDPWDVEAEVGDVEFADPGERPANVVAFDDVPFDKDGDKRLGAAAGSVQTGLNWVRRDSGREGSQLHCHSADSEAFVILDGDGTLELVRAPYANSEAPQDGEHPVRAGHVIARPPASRVAHHLVAGPGGLTYLVYGTREPNDICFYPRSGEIFLRGVGVSFKSS